LYPEKRDDQIYLNNKMMLNKGEQQREGKESNSSTPHFRVAI
jgi:hypothetical protein